MTLRTIEIGNIGFFADADVGLLEAGKKPFRQLPPPVPRFKDYQKKVVPAIVAEPLTDLSWKPLFALNWIGTMVALLLLWRFVAVPVWISSTIG